MPTITQEEGSEIILDQEVLAPVGGWTDEATAGSDVFRRGPEVHVCLRVTNVARTAWSAKKWKVGEYVTSGGKLYKLLKESGELTIAEEGPTVYEEVNAAPTLVCILPVEYRPGAAVKDAAGTVEVLANGEVLALGSLSASAAHVFDLTYRAAGVSP